MVRSFRVFDYSGTALALPAVNFGVLDEFFRAYPEVKRVELYERTEEESIWDEKLIKTYHAKDFIKGRK